MRSFVITMPGLSVARPGQIRSADELGMDDDQLDAFVEAGYALEVFSEEAEPPEAFDPSDYTVAEVEEYLDAHPDEAEAILAAEAEGKNRTTLTGDG